MRTALANHPRARLTSTVLCLVVAALAIHGRPVAAQPEEPDPFAGVEEMVVVGTGTAALLAPTSTSAIAFDSNQLEAIGVEDISDIAAYVPNLEIRSQNATNASFFIRGVGLQDFGANASSSVPIFQDGVARNPSASQLVGLFDVSGLSVLKGPQGSGNYRNASAGAFIVNTRKPEPEFSGKAKATIARIVSVEARDAFKYSFDAAMNAPVWGDVASVRVAARYAHEVPWWENGCANRIPIADRAVATSRNDPAARLCNETVTTGSRTDVDPFLSRYLGEVDDFGFRGSIRLQPPDAPLDTTFRVEVSRLNRDSTLGQFIGTGGRFKTLAGEGGNNYIDPDIAVLVEREFNRLAVERPDLNIRERNNLSRAIISEELRDNQVTDDHPYRGDFDSPGRTILETHSASMNSILDLDYFDVEVNFGFVDYRKSEARDTDLSPERGFPSSGNDQAWEIYSDVAVKGDTVLDVPVDWDTGFYVMTEKVEAQQSQLVNELERVTEFTQQIFSFGTYLQGRYEFLENFELAGGVRYNWERKDFEVIEFQNNVSRQNADQSQNQRTWDFFTGFGEIRYSFTEDIATFLKYTKGFKAGHFNPSEVQSAKIPDVGFADPEQIDSVEWGLEFAFWSDRLSGNLGFFFYNYKNYQVFRLTTTFRGVFRTIQSAKQARNYGSEIELTIRPLEGYVPPAIERLSINFRGGWLRTNYVEFSVQESRLLGTAGTFGVSIDYSGNPLINAAELQVATTFTWPIDLGRLGTLTPIYDLTWTDDTPFDPNKGRGELSARGESIFSPFVIGNRSFILHNVRLSWKPSDDAGVEVAGYCRNVTDQRYKTFSVDISTFNSQQLHYLADPRTCGAEMSVTW